MKIQTNLYHITIGAEVLEERKTFIGLEDLALDLGDCLEPLNAAHVGLLDGVVAAAGPAQHELLPAQSNPGVRLLETLCP